MSTTTILALDVGGVRIGVAQASSHVRIAQPLTYLANSPDVAKEIEALITEHQAETLVVGLPRGLDGQETDQTKTVRKFVENLRKTITIPILWQDEALTSHQAEEELKQRGGQYQKGDVDSLAATYILHDYLEDSRELKT